MRISDWSSDVCSSDLLPHLPEFILPADAGELRAGAKRGVGPVIDYRGGARRAASRHREHDPVAHMPDGICQLGKVAVFEAAFKRKIDAKALGGRRIDRADPLRMVREDRKRVGEGKGG